MVAFARLSHFPSLPFSPPSTIHIHRTMLCLTRLDRIRTCTHTYCTYRLTVCPVMRRMFFFVDWRWFRKSKRCPRHSIPEEGEAARFVRLDVLSSCKSPGRHLYWYWKWANVKFPEYFSRMRVQKPDSREQPRRSLKSYYTRIQQ